MLIMPGEGRGQDLLHADDEGRGHRGGQCLPPKCPGLSRRTLDQLSVKENGTGVLIVQHPLALDPIHYLNNKLAGRGGANYFDLADRKLKGGHPRNSALIVYSQYTNRTQRNSYPPILTSAISGRMSSRSSRTVTRAMQKVAVYPYAGMQHQEIELDG